MKQVAAIIFFFLMFTGTVSSSVLAEESLEEEILRAVGYWDPVTRDFAVILASRFPGNYNIDQICSIYEYIKSEWKYVSDPYWGEYFAHASESVQIGLAGDCDDFVILMAAVVKAIGGASRIKVAINESESHAYAEVFVDSKWNSGVKRMLQDLANIYNDSIWYSTDSDGTVWLNLDWSANHPGGPYFEGDIVATVYP